MKKVAIISCYFKHNYGSMLQAYATQIALDKIGYENETVNIDGFKKEINKAKRKYFIKASMTSGILKSKIGMVINALIKKYSNGEYAKNSKIRGNKFSDFKINKFVLSEEFKSKKELSEKCKEKYSAVIVGSDQLWLPANIAGDYYTLSFVPDSVNSIAYSTSFGQATLPKDSSQKASIFLNRIRHIGVREESGQKLVEKLTGRKVPVVCDPTLLLTSEEWSNLIQKDSIINDRYILCYFLGKNPLHRDFADNLRKTTGCKIVALTHLDEYVKSDNTYADITPYDIDPLDFLNLIKNATYVCTDSFHCSVFSILFKKVFFTFRRHAANNKHSTNSRLDTLFSLTGIHGRIKNGDEDINECLSQKIDFTLALSNIEKSREFSYEYLNSALQDERSTDID